MNNKIYEYYGFKCIDFINLCTRKIDGYQGFLLGNIIKYVYRAGVKNNNIKEDLVKALDYLKEFKEYNDEYLYEKLYLTTTQFYSYIVCFIEMEHYKNKFFSCLLYSLISPSESSLKKLSEILEVQIKE